MRSTAWVVPAQHGKSAEAKVQFEKAISLDKDQAGAMNGLALALKAQGKADEAIKTWEDMLKQFPGVNAGPMGWRMRISRRSSSPRRPSFTSRSPTRTQRISRSGRSWIWPSRRQASGMKRARRDPKVGTFSGRDESNSSRPLLVTFLIV